jgi:hypothetical protein
MTDDPLATLNAAEAPPADFPTPAEVAAWQEQLRREAEEIEERRRQRRERRSA